MSREGNIEPVFRILPNPKLVKGDIAEPFPASLWGMSMDQEHVEREAERKREKSGGWSVVGDDEVKWGLFSGGVIVDIVNWLLRLISTDRKRLTTTEEKIQATERAQADILSRLAALENGSGAEEKQASSAGGERAETPKTETMAAAAASSAEEKLSKKRRRTQGDQDDISGI